MSSSGDARYAGLSTSQARVLLERDGPNELPAGAGRTPLRIALDVVREPMLAMLLAAGGAYLLLGDRAEALTLLLFACLSIVITIVQEAKAENALEALRSLSAPQALVIRDGTARRIAGREVVEGDIVILAQGDRVPADAFLLETRELQADESSLTGESVPVGKRAARQGETLRAEPGGEDQPQVFSGTILTRGDGIAQVTATGNRSRIGQIGRSLEALEVEVPHLQRETSRIVKLSAIGGLSVALAVMLLYGYLRGGWLDAFLAGIATAMSLLPEEFPVVLAIFLAMGAWRIAQAGVLTRRAAAIEAMGAVTVLCTDKTGTLTQNRMTVAALWLPGEPIALAGGTADPRYGVLLEASALASAPLPTDPMEIAFHSAARQAGIDIFDGRELVRSLGLRSDLLAVSNMWRRPTDEASPIIAAKGAPEAIAKLCRLDGDAHREMTEAALIMAERGMRVIGIASAEADEKDPDKTLDAHAFRLLGLAGLADPLRPDVREAVAQCRSAGIRIVMITGDYTATARAIADQAGIESGALMTGEDVAALPDEAFATQVGDVAIFARTMPEGKLRIVSALKASGEIVAMTGDGVNDAPALKAAHVGVAMGKRGTDVAREAAAIVLVDDDFGAIVAAIRIGRRIYDNIRKALGFIFGVHVPIAGLAILPLGLGTPIILGPLQIALLEMVIDPVCALVFEAEREETRLMQRPPRDPHERLFSTAVVMRGIVQGGMALMLVGALYLGADLYGVPENELRALTFFALLAAILALVLANRSFSTSLSHALLRHNIAFRYVLAFVVGGAALILTVSPIQQILDFAPLSVMELALAASTGIVLLVACEAVKGRDSAPSPAP